VLCGPASGQEAQKGGAPAAIEEVVVTARRREENLQTTPVAVTSLGSNDLQKRQILNLYAIQTATPNVTISNFSSDKSSATVSIRGQIQTDANIMLDPPVGVYQDGVYIARSNGALMDLVDVQRVEVLRGPQGTLFGRNTTGGAINIVGNRPTDHLEGSLSARFGNFDARQVTGVLNAPLTDAVMMRAAGRISLRDGYIENLTRGIHQTNDDVKFVRANVLVAPPGADWSLLLSGDYSLYKDRGTANVLLDALQGGTGATAAAQVIRLTGGARTIASFLSGDPFAVQNDADSFDRVRTSGVSATFEDRLGSATFKSITAYRTARRRSLNDFDGLPLPVLHTAPSIDQWQLTQELQLFGDFGGHGSWIGGLYYFHEKGHDIANTVTAGSITDGTGDNNSVAGYGQASYGIAPQVKINAGLRYTRDRRQLTNHNHTSAGACTVPTLAASTPIDQCFRTSRADFDYWSYLLGVDWQPARDVFLYAKTSRAYRAGGFNLRQGTLASAQAFQPEQLTDYEVGAKLEFLDRRLRLNAAAFYSKVQNLQRTQVPAGAVGAFVVSAGRAHIEGMEFELVAAPTASLRLTANLGLLSPHYDQFSDASGDRSGEPFVYAPKTTAGVAADYTVQLARGADLVLHADYAWKSAFYHSSDPSPTLTAFAREPAYGLLNAQATYTSASGDWQLSVWGQNLADKTYYVKRLVVLGEVIGYPAAPRTYGVQVTRKF